MLINMQKENIAKTLNERFVVPPFSVFNTHQPYWKNRMLMWRDLGLCGTNGRVTGMNGLSYDNRRMDKHKENPINGTSTFSPVLCEVVYKWFTTPNSKILDPFAGGITRGAIASILGHNYRGYDININQVNSNNEEYTKLLDKYVIEGSCNWVACDVRQDMVDAKYDFIFTCPPYYNLEVYSDNPMDLSTKGTYDEFLVDYSSIISECYKLLNDNCFMVWVVSDVRDKKTTEYYGLVADTIKIAQNIGFKFYNEIVLYNETGNLAITSGDYMRRARKVGRQHQNVLVFYKGDINSLKAKFSEVKIDG